MIVAIVAYAASAFAEPIDRLIGELPPDLDMSGYVFSYVRRTPGLEGDIAARAILTEIETELVRAMAKPEAARRATGVDLGRVDAVLQTGEPGKLVLLLAGGAGFADDAGSVLKARGYKVQEADTGRPVCAFTNPNDLDEERPEYVDADPFGQGGRSYCVVSMGDRAIVAASRVVMQEAMARHSARPACPVCTLLASMIASAKSARGSRGEIVSAFGVALSAHAGQSDVGSMIGGILDGSKKFEDIEAHIAAEMARKRSPIPPHLLALLSAARSADAEVAQMTLLYSDRAQAEAAASVIRDRLVAFARPEWRTKPGAIDLTYHPVADGRVVAVLSLNYPNDERRAGLGELAGWIEATFNRSFSVLDPLK